MHMTNLEMEVIAGHIVASPDGNFWTRPEMECIINEVKDQIDDEFTEGRLNARISWHQRVLAKVIAKETI